MSDKETKLTPVQQIVQHTVNKEPSQLAAAVNKEISSRVMDQIASRREEVGSRLFGK